MAGSWGLKKSLVGAAIVVATVASFLYPSRGCRFPAIYNFGDSNSDTGAATAAFGRLPPPYGETFFGKTSGRYSDGRLIIDFIGKWVRNVHGDNWVREAPLSIPKTVILCSYVFLIVSSVALIFLPAESLGLPLVNAYLDSIGSNFSHGANFAASGSTMQPVNAKIYGAGFNPFSLNVQLLQFEQLQDRTAELYAQGSDRSCWFSFFFFDLKWPNCLYFLVFQLRYQRSQASSQNPRTSRRPFTYWIVARMIFTMDSWQWRGSKWMNPFPI